MVGKTYGEKGFTNLHSSEDQPRQASAVLRLLLPEGSRALFPRGLPESEGYAVTPEIILPRNTHFRISGRAVGVDGQVYVDAEVVKPPARKFPKPESPKPKKPKPDPPQSPGQNPRDWASSASRATAL